MAFNRTSPKWTIKRCKPFVAKYRQLLAAERQDLAQDPLKREWLEAETVKWVASLGLTPGNPAPKKIVGRDRWAKHLEKAARVKHLI